MVDNHKKKITNDPARTLLRDDFFDHPVLDLRVNRRTLQKIAQFRGRRESLAKICKLSHRRLWRALSDGDVREGVGVLLAP
jgi:hypothetical protein